jgi:hypothetical protein
VTGQWFFPDSPVFSINKTDHHDITEILLKVAFSTIKPKKEHASTAGRSIIFLIVMTLALGDHAVK